MTEQKRKPIAVTKYLTYEECPYRYILDSYDTNNFDFLMHESAYIGIFKHRVLERFYNKNVSDSDFESIIEEVSDEILEKINGVSLFSYKDIGEYIANFGFEKIHSKTILAELVRIKRPKKILSAMELTIVSPDGILVGRPDWMIFEKGASAVIDYKSGDIFRLDEFNNYNIKFEYVLQLKLYAYLFFCRYNFFPKKLLIYGNDLKYHEIHFMPEECVELFHSVKSLFFKIHEANNEIKTNVESKKCTHCINRYRCKFYINDHKNLNETNDVFGFFTEISVFKNGNFNLKIEDGDDTILIQRCAPSILEKIKPFQNMYCGFFNLRRISPLQLIYEITKRTALKGYVNY
jgi:hypothetical protein